APNGAILSLSVDGTLARTARDGSSVVVARGVARAADSTYAPVRHLLAFACDPADLCFYDAARDAPIPRADILRGTHPYSVSLSRDGNRLAVMTEQSELMVLDVVDPARPAVRFRKPIAHGADVRFFEDDIVAVNTIEAIEFVHLGGGSEVFPAPDNAYYDVSPDEHLFAITDMHGRISVVEGSPVHLAAHSELCRDRFAGIQFIPGRRSVAYACRDGSVGIWDLARDAIHHRLQLEGHADDIAVSPAGDYIVAAGGTGAISVLDLTTDLVSTYRGHEFRVSALAPPTAEPRLVISADVRGAVRAWPTPTRIARVAATTRSRFYSAFLDGAGTTITATTFQPELTVVSPAGTRSTGPHDDAHILLQPSSTGATFAAYGNNDVIELWSSATMARTRSIATGQSSVTQLGLVGDTGDVISSGRDGRLVRWAASGDETLLARLDQPIDGFALLAATGSIVFSTADGALWRSTPGTPPSQLRPGGSRIIALLATADEHTVYAGDVGGDVVAIDTRSWHPETAFHAASSIQQLSVTPDGDTLAVATDGGLIHLRTRDDDAPASGATRWSTLRAHARHQALTSDGVLIVLGTDGTIWLYSTPHRRWLCVPVGATDLRWVAVSANGSTAVVVDYEGRLLSIDLDAARNLLASLP
ncbi:MAG TPA: WD40 repeat domain-containing protein, partial [Kofleriaceae bacterium]